MQITAILADKGGELLHYTDVATAILSRDYKGLGNWGSNGVIEIYESD